MPDDAADDPEILFRAIFETSQDAIGVSLDGVHKLVNPSYLRLFGYDRVEEVIGRSILDLIAPEARPAILERVRLRSAGALPERQGYETRGLRRDGTVFDMEVRVSPYVRQGRTWTLVILRDVTPWKMAQAALAESAEFFRALFDVNTAVKLLLDPRDGSIVEANRAACDFYGYTAEELKRMRISDINTLSHEEVLRELEAARSGRRTFFRFRHRVASGPIRLVEIYSGPVELRGRTLLLSIVHDVTDREQLQEQLLHAQKMEAVGRLAGGIAHDFNNLLTVMMVTLDFMLEEAPPGATRDGLEQVLRSALKAEALTRQLLAFGRRQVLEPRSLDLGAVISDMRVLILRALGEQVRLVLDLQATTPVLADQGQLEQVLMNLAVNARAAMPRGGTLVVRTRDVPGAEVPGSPEGRWVRLDVADDGVGMEEAVRARVFEPFFTTRHATGGTGLGLATVYGIVQQSGGQIAVESRPGHGTTFRVHLPEAPEAPAPAAEVARPGVSSVLKRATLLVVEDEDDLRPFLVGRLRAAGYDVIEAADGGEALRLSAEVDGIDLLLSDVVMPGASGIEVYAALQARWPDLPALFISGYSEDLVAGGSRLGPRASFLAKPFTGPALLARVEEVLAKAPR